MCSSFKEIPSFPMYAICPHGHVYSRFSKKILKVARNRKDYIRYSFMKDGKHFMKYAHSLVAETFIGTRPKGLQVDHIDGNKENNHHSNLRYVSAKENINHNISLGKLSAGDNHGMAKITSKIATEIRNRFKRTGPRDSNTKELVKEFGISKNQIYNIVNGKSWAVQGEQTEIKEVYVLLADGDGTMRSSDEPFGVAVSSENEAKRYVVEKGVGFSHSYQKLVVFNDKDEAIKFAFKK